MAPTLCTLYIIGRQKVKENPHVLVMGQLRVGHSGYRIEGQGLENRLFLCRNGISLSTGWLSNIEHRILNNEGELVRNIAPYMLHAANQDTARKDYSGYVKGRQAPGAACGRNQIRRTNPDFSEATETTEDTES